MRIFAQRIGKPGHPIDCYVYLHGTVREPVTWQGPPPPELLLPTPVLVRHPASKTREGHFVLSYFSVLAPDDVRPGEIGTAYSRLYRSTTWVEAAGRCLAQFSCEQSIADIWRSELQLLFVRAAAELTSLRTDAALPSGSA